MSSKPIIIFEDVWKKYSACTIMHRSLRDDIIELFTKKNRTGIARDEFWALQGINLHVSKGEYVGLYGHNGAGKSTILKLISNVTYPTRGCVTVMGRVAPLIEVGAGFHPDLSGRENIFMNGTIIGMKINEVREKIGEIIAFSELGDFIDMPVKKYSSGMYMRLGFSIAVHSLSEIILIDEVLSVGDEQFQAKCIDKIMGLKKSGKTVFVVSHSKRLLESVVDRIYYVQHGSIEN